MYSFSERVHSLSHPYAIKTAPTGSGLAVSVTQVKSWLRLDICEEFELEMLIKSAQKAFEKYTKLTLFTTEFTTKRDCFSQDWELRRGPMQAITRFQYRVNNVLTAVDPTIYFLHKAAEFGFGYPALYENQIWPSDVDDRKDAIEIDFTAGFSEIPEDIKLAILYTVADSYSNRGDCGGDSGCGGSGPFGLSAKAIHIADSYKIIDIGGGL